MPQGNGFLLLLSDVHLWLQNKFLYYSFPFLELILPSRDGFKTRIEKERKGILPPPKRLAIYQYFRASPPKAVADCQVPHMEESTE